MHSVHASSSQLLKSTQVTCRCQVKSNVIKSTVVDLGSFYPQVGSRFCTAATRRSSLTAICDFVYSCQTGLRNLIGVRLFTQDCPETCQNGRCRNSDHSYTRELEQASSMADRVS